MRKVLMAMCVLVMACGSMSGTDGGTGGGGGGTATGGGRGGGSTQKQVVNVTADITADTTWTKDNIYVLKQLTYVTAGTLTVQAGTEVQGDQSSALIVSRGAKLVAEGTASEPIVFTSSLPVGSRGTALGDWGGLVFLGRAHINDNGGEGNAEGLADDPKNKYGGGASPDDTYNCGTLKYVRVEFAGRALMQDNELNGITFNACGSGTTVDYVQVHRGIDDGIEIFGGTMDLKHAVLTHNDDDGLDWDKGWNGRAQFVVVQQAAGFGNHGFEASNNSANGNAMPRARPTIFNATLVGRKPDTAATEGKSRGIIFKEGTGALVSNTVVTNFTDLGVLVDGAATAAIWGTDLKLQNSVFFENPGSLTNYTVDPKDGGVAIDVLNEPTALAEASLNNRFDLDPKLTAATNTTTPNFKPQAGSPVLTGGATPPSGGFFDTSATFVGAIGADDWTAGWTAYPAN